MLSIFLLSSLAHAEPATLARCADAGPPLPGEMPAVFQRVVRIETARGTGSGVVISPDGFVLTAAHVVEGSMTTKVVFSDETTAEATVVRANAAADLALLRLPSVGLPCLPLADARLPPAADTWIVGSPGGKALTGSVTKGIVSGYRERSGWAVLQTDASINSGNSGGPLLGSDGHIQAIVSYKVMGIGTEGLGFAVAAEEVARGLDIRFGDSSDTEIASASEELPAGSVPVHVDPPSFTDKPSNPGAPPRGNVCAEVNLEKDPFNGSARMVARGASLFDLTWATGEPPILTAYYPVRSSAAGVGQIVLNEAAYLPAGLTLDILLANGTKIHLVSQGAEWRGVGLFGVVAARFEVNQEVAQAIAGSGPTWLRWTAEGGEPVDQDRSDRQRERYYRPLFACLAKQLEEQKD